MGNPVLSSQYACLRSGSGVWNGGAHTLLRLVRIEVAIRDDARSLTSLNDYHAHHRLPIRQYVSQSIQPQPHLQQPTCTQSKKKFRL